MSETTQQRIERIAREAADWAERVYNGSGHLAHYVTKQAVLHALTAFAEEQEKWLPISSAPKDGTWVILATSEGIDVRSMEGMIQQIA